MIERRIEVTAERVSWAISNLPSPLGMYALVRGKANNRGIIDMGGK